MSNPNASAAPSWRSRAYLFVVATFAIVCGFIAVHRGVGVSGPPQSVAVTIALAPESGPLPSSIEEAFDQATIDDQLLTRVLEKIRADTPRFAPLTPETVAPRLSITPRHAAAEPKPASESDGNSASEEEPHSWSVVLRYSGDFETGKAVTKELAAQFTHVYVFRPALAVQNRLNATIAAVEQASSDRTRRITKVHEAEARSEYLRLALSELPPAEELQRIMDEPAPPSPSESETLPVIHEADLALQQRLQQLNSQLDLASQTYTPEHPILQDLVRQQRALKRDLLAREKATPSQDAGRDQAGESAVAAWEQRRQLARQSLLKRSELEEQLEKLTTEIEPQQARIAMLEEELAELADKQRLVEAEWLQHDQIELVLSEPQSQFTADGRSNNVVMMFALMLGVFGAVAASTVGLPADSVLRTPEQASAAVALPVIGVLSATASSPHSALYRMPSATRYLKLGSELVLATMLVSACGLAVFKAGYLEQFANQPLVELSDSIRNLAIFLTTG